MSPANRIPTRAIVAIKDAVYALDALTHPSDDWERTPIVVSPEAVQYLDTWVRARLQTALGLLTPETPTEETP